MVGSGQLVSLWNLEAGACVNEFKGHKGRYVMYIISTAIKKMHLQNLRLICIKLDSVRKLKSISHFQTWIIASFLRFSPM